MDASHRELLRLSLPLVASNLSIPLLGLVDTAVAGHLPHATSLAAVATGSAVASVVLLGLNFLRTGTTGLAAQAAGADDFEETKLVFTRAAVLALGLATALVLLRTVIADGGVAIMQPPADTVPEANAYLRIRMLAAPFLLMNLALSGWFLGLGRPAVAVVIAVTVNLVNAALDLALVWGLDLGVPGLAWASVGGEAAGMLSALPAAAAQLRGWRPERAAIFEPTAWRRMLSLNSDLLVRTLSLTGSFAFFTSQAGRFGEAALAANAVLMQMQALMSYGLDGFAHAAEVMVGQALGRRDPAATRTAIRVALQWSAGTALGIAAGYALLGSPLIGLLTDIDAVRLAAHDLLPWMIASPLVSVWAFTFDGVYIGGTWSRTMRNSMVVSATLYVAATYALLPYGHHGLWAAFLGFLALRGLWLGAALPGHLARLAPARV